MNINLKLLLVLILGISFESTVSFFPLKVIRFDLIWILVLYFGFYGSYLSGTLIVFALGFLQETFGLPIHGILILTYLLLFYFLKAVDQKISFQNIFSQMSWIVILTFFQKLMEAALLKMQGYEFVFSLRYVLSFCFLEAFLGLVVFKFLDIRKPEFNAYGH